METIRIEALRASIEVFAEHLHYIDQVCLQLSHTGHLSERVIDQIASEDNQLNQVVLLLSNLSLGSNEGYDQLREALTRTGNADLVHILPNFGQNSAKPSKWKKVVIGSFIGLAAGAALAVGGPVLLGAGAAAGAGAGAGGAAAGGAAVGAGVVMESAVIMGAAETAMMVAGAEAATGLGLAAAAGGAAGAVTGGGIAAALPSSSRKTSQPISGAGERHANEVIPSAKAEEKSPEEENSGYVPSDTLPEGLQRLVRSSSEEDQGFNLANPTVLSDTRYESLRSGPTLPSYPVRTASEGVGSALIINNIDFDYFARRNGSDEDQRRLKDLLSYLGFNVLDYPNLRKTEMEQKLIEFSRLTEHSNASCTAVFIMTHGLNGFLCGRDSEIRTKKSYDGKRNILDISGSKLISIQNVIEWFRPRNCDILRHKPKLFFFQACRSNPHVGEDFLSVNNSLGIKTPLEFLLRINEHFFIGYPTFEGNDALRTTHGTFYLRTVAEVFRKYAVTEDVASMMVEVNRVLYEKSVSLRCRMEPYQILKLDRKLFFKPDQ